MLAEHGLPDADAELPVPAAVEDMLGTRVAGLPPPARRLLLATALSEGLHVDVLEAIGDAAAVEDALDAGVLRADGDRVRAAHPLLAAAAPPARAPEERRASTPRSPPRSASRSSARCISRSPRRIPTPRSPTEVESAAARAAARGGAPKPSRSPSRRCA